MYFFESSMMTMYDAFSNLQLNELIQFEIFQNTLRRELTTEATSSCP